MKRLFSVFLTVLLVFCLSSSAYADAEQTDRRGCFEFTELFISRLDELSYNTGTDFDLLISKPLCPTASENGKVLFFDTSAGTLWLDSGDLSLVGIDMTLRDDTVSDEENLAHVSKCIVAISALECSQAEDGILRISSKIQGDPKNAYEVGEEIADQLLAGINSGALKEAVETKSDVFLYSGNYDYYVSYITGEKPDGTKIGFINLHAESRQ